MGVKIPRLFTGLLSRDPIHHVTKHLQQGIESDHFRVKKNMPKIGGFQSFNTARPSIQGFAAAATSCRMRCSPTSLHSDGSTST